MKDELLEALMQKLARAMGFDQDAPSDSSQDTQQENDQAQPTEQERNSTEAPDDTQRAMAPQRPDVSDAA